MKDQYLSVTQVAALKGTSRSAVYKAIQEGRLSSVRLLGVVGIKQEEALAWIPRSRNGKGASEETKRKISLSQQRRWYKRKQQDSSSP